MRKIRSIIAALAVMAPLSLASVFTSCDKDVKVSEVQIQPAEVTLGIGETQKITVTVSPDNATNPAYVLESGNTAVATVAGDVVTAVAPGETVVTATSADGNHTAACKVTVVKHAEDITIAPTQAKVTVGKTLEISVEFTPADATIQTVTWESSNTEVASVVDGIVTGIAAGEALITATSVDGGFSAACKVVVEPEYDGVVATSAGGYYCGDQYGTGYDEDFLYLLSGDVKEGGLSLAGKGTALWLDLNLPKTGSTTLPAHSYIPLLSDDQDQSYTWLPGTDMGAYGVIGSLIYSYQDGDSEPQYIMVENGSVDITLNGADYTVNAVVTAGGNEYKFRYTGPIALKDVKDAGDPPAQEYTVVDLGKDLTQCYMEFYGDIYGTKGVSNNWTIYLADNQVDFSGTTLVGPGRIMMLELNTAPADGKVLPVGTFEVLNPTSITSAASLVPYTAVPGLLDNNNGVYGSWYLASEEKGGQFSPLAGATSGTVTVQKSVDTYTIDLNISDDDYKIQVKGTYVGVPNFYDGTQKSSVSAVRPASAGKAKGLDIHKSARRIAFRK